MTVKDKLSYYLVIAVGCAVTALVFQILSIPGHRRDREKAAKLDEICTYAKRTVELDAQVIRSTNPADAEFAKIIVLRVNGDRVGDGAVHLQWCMRSEFPALAWAACRDKDCWARILEDAARTIQ